MGSPMLDHFQGKSNITSAEFLQIFRKYDKDGRKTFLYFPVFAFKSFLFHFATSLLNKIHFSTLALREKCPNTELFLVRIFPYSVQIPENTDQKKFRIWRLFFSQC